MLYYCISYYFVEYPGMTGNHNNNFVAYEFLLVFLLIMYVDTALYSIDWIGILPPCLLYKVISVPYSDLSGGTLELLFELYDRSDGNFLGLGIVGIEELVATPSQRQIIPLQSRPYENDNVSGSLTVEVSAYIF